MSAENRRESGGRTARVASPAGSGRLRAEGRAALVPFVTAGDPDFEVTRRLLPRLVEAGADAIELGVPFSDPMADGPVIQRAGERALAAGTTLAGVLDLARGFRESDRATPLVLMGYLNPIEAMGYARFADAAAASGVDGGHRRRHAAGGGRAAAHPPSRERHRPRVPALPHDVAGADAPDRGRGPRVPLLRLVQGDHRRRPSRHRGGGAFARRGTGRVGPSDRSRVRDRGRGRRPAVAAVADAVVVGSAIVRRVEEALDAPERIPGHVAAFVAELRSAVEAASKVEAGPR